MGTLNELPSVHNHRLNHNPSKLPSYRGTDLLSGPPPRAPVRTAEPAAPADEPKPAEETPNAYATQTSEQHRQHTRHHSDAASSPSKTRPSLPLARPLTFPGVRASSTSVSSITAKTIAKPRNVPALHSRNGLRDSWTGPPPAMRSMIQRSDSSTSDWVAEQATIPPLVPPVDIPTPVGKSPTDQHSKPPLTPLIPPIRGFRSSRRSTEMSATPRRSSMEQDNQDETLRALEGFDRIDSQRSSNREQEEQNSDDSDLFLKLAREEARANNPQARGLVRRSQVDRQSIPPSRPTFHPAPSRRRGSDQESATGARPTDESGTMSQALVYRPSARDRVAPLEDLNKSRYYGATSRSNPTTPRALGSRDISPESQVSYGGRRPSVPDSVLPARTNSYRQSNLSYSTPRTYNSSPLVSRTADVHDTLETPRAAEGTESTVSTTAPSTVWDELEDLKSRIHRLELTGKLPATSGAAISRASNERPPTATTTVTTMSLSPKRGRANSTSPIDSVEVPSTDTHPLLHSALAKSKSLLSHDVYKALETAASDALAITAMMGTSGQPGPISSSQSTVGGASGPATDRQVRRKADSMCRSLTELCLALSEVKNEQVSAPNNQIVLRPSSRDDQTITNVEVSKQRPPVNSDLTRGFESTGSTKKQPSCHELVTKPEVCTFGRRHTHSVINGWKEDFVAHPKPTWGNGRAGRGRRDKISSSVEGKYRYWQSEEFSQRVYFPATTARHPAICNPIRFATTSLHFNESYRYGAAASVSAAESGKQTIRPVQLEESVPKKLKESLLWAKALHKVGQKVSHEERGNQMEKRRVLTNERRGATHINM
ncbi:hypothetical protein D0Z07_1315 [Hyphodiscus hymeniophilus]|uniref:Uncharacterized protein n=1 Tax=Hyphodiscus hymeniophilus TaxID=353542 RepID=A0A9P6VPH7_9HELO|nr:hypothetical protein D0Z07_1315 [Hyphodiscus hymeniophilus]